MASMSVSKTEDLGSSPSGSAKRIKKGGKALAPYGEVVILSFGKFGVLIEYTSGLLEGREARIAKSDLKGL